MMFRPRIYTFLLFFIFLLYLNLFGFAHAEKISDKRLCGDRNCQSLISKAKTLARHKPTDPAFLPFDRGVTIDIYSKSAGSRQDLWGGELNGKRGYFPRSFVRETKVENPNPQHVLDTEYHVPLEERIRGGPDRGQVPHNARTVKRENRHQEIPHQQQQQQQQQSTDQVPDRKEEEIEEKANQDADEIVDETEIGDETEILEDEQEIENVETGSPDSTGQASDRETDSLKAEEKEEASQETEAETDETDPTEVDETEIADDDIETEEKEKETEESKDEPEADETEVAEEDEDAPSEEVKESDKEKDEDENANIDQVPVDTSNDIVEEEEKEDIHADEIKETLKAKEGENEELKDEPSEKKEEGNESGDKKEGETTPEADETENEDDEEGSMFGSIWSDENEGKIGEIEDIDINKLSHGEHVSDTPNPDINTGDHIDDHTDTFFKDNIKSGNGTLHDSVNDGDEERSVNYNSVMHENGNGKDTEENKDLEKAKNIEINLNKESNGRTQRGNEGVVETEAINNQLSSSKDFNDTKNNDDEKNKTEDESLSAESEANAPNEQEIIQDAEKEPHVVENLVNGVENGNVHLKDILKSSLPDGNNVHQYIVEHAAPDHDLPAPEVLGNDKFNIKIDKDESSEHKDDLLNAENNMLETHNVNTNAVPDEEEEEDDDDDDEDDDEDDDDDLTNENNFDNSKGIADKYKHIDTVLSDDNDQSKTVKENQEKEQEVLQSAGFDTNLKPTDSGSAVDVKGVNVNTNEKVTRNDADAIKDERTEDENGTAFENPGNIDILKSDVTEKITVSPKLDISEETVNQESKDYLEVHSVSESNSEKDQSVTLTGMINAFDTAEELNMKLDGSKFNVEGSDTEKLNTEQPNDERSEKETIEIAGDRSVTNDSTTENIERKNLHSHRDAHTEKTFEISADETIIDRIPTENTKDVENMNINTQQDAHPDGQKNEIEDETKEITDEAFTSPFKKTEDTDEETDNEDKMPSKPSDTEPVESNLDDKNIGTLEENATPPVEHAEEKLSEKEETKDNTIKDNANEEKLLDNFQKAMEAITIEKQEENTENSKDGKDDLRFVNDQGEIIQDELDKVLEKHDHDEQETNTNKVTEMEENVKETNINQDDNRQQIDTSGKDLNEEQKQIDDQKQRKFEELASGMMSILATHTSIEPSAEITSTAVENIIPSETFPEIADKIENTILTETDSETRETESLMISSTQTVFEQVTTGFPDDQISSQTNDVDKNEPVQVDARGGGVVIDGTTFDADDFGDEITSSSVQATEEILVTASLDNTVLNPAGEIKPTKLFEVPSETKQTLLPLDMQTDVYGVDNEILKNQQTQIDEPGHIQASETVKEELVNQANVLPEKVNVLSTSFNSVTSKVEETQTQPIESVQVVFETLAVTNNETVTSDIVQDQVQPSLDQNAYNTDVFISRKPLSTEPAAETSAETNVHGQETSTEGQQVGDEQTETKQETDQNNNEVTEKVDEAKDEGQGDWTHFSTESTFDDSSAHSTTELPEQLDPYSSVEHLNSRKVPDPDLDEDFPQPDEPFIKVLEPYLKSLINMLPPSLQSVLEQEPLGLSPTITMLVSMISTNVLALLTCFGCMCKGKKKQAGKKDPLVVIRDLEEKLFIATKEKENLEDDLQLKTKKLTEMQDEITSEQSTKGSVETNLKTIKLHNESLKKQLSEVQTELDEYKQEVTEKSQVVVYKDSELQTYLAEIQTLTQRAQDAEMALQKLSQGLGEKEEELRSSLQQVQSLSELIQQLETSKQQLQDEAVHWSEKVKDLSEQVEQYSSESKRMQEDLAFKENELEVLRDCFLQVKAFQGEDEMKEETEESLDLGEKLKQMMDVSRVNASLLSVEEERDVLQNKLLIEVESRKELEDQVQLLKRKFESNQTDKMKAERQSQEAQTKLEVLSKYFKEKEAELTRQLGEQEVLKNQNISKLESSDSITQELAKENDSYRQQIEDLKTEITKAERDFRSQIAANEKKAHENWLATRAAERELKESRHECGMLRQKLTDLERKLMQGPPPGLIRPITHRAMPPPGMLNGPRPPPPPERPGSRGSVHGHVTPRLRDDDYRASPIGPDRMPPPPDRRLPPGPMGPRPPPPPLDAMSPPPYAIRPPFPPDRRSPPSFDRYPPPRGPRPPFPRPPPPHLRSPPLMGSIPPEHDDSKQDPYSRAPQGSRERGTTRHQSQV